MENEKDSLQAGWPEHLETWFSGEADASTKEFVERWRQESAQNQLVFEAFGKAFGSGHPAWVKQISVEQYWQELQAQITDQAPVLWAQPETGEEKKSHTLRNMVLALVSVAAALVLVLNFWQSPTETFTVASGPGQRLVWLPDSSKVMLNQESSLTYQEGFGQTHRELAFEGQGFFEVTPNTALPFKIKSGRSLTQVVGTSFDLQVYPQQTTERLAVLTGQVQYQPDGAEAATLVKAGEHVEFASASHTLTHKSGALNEQLRWSGRFAFEQERLSTVLAQLSEYYHTEIKLANKQASNCLLTASFSQDKLEDVLEVISFSLQMEWSKQGNQYMLRGNSCKK